MSIRLKLLVLFIAIGASNIQCGELRRRIIITPPRDSIENFVRVAVTRPERGTDVLTALERANRAYPSADIILQIYSGTEDNGIPTTVLQEAFEHITPVTLSVTGLILHGTITCLPTNLSGLNRLSSLRISGSGLINPPCLQDFPHLTYLDLSDNELTEWPNLFNLSQLESLDLSSNRLTEAPDNTFLNQLPSLHHLNLHNNQITVPPDVSNITRFLLIFIGNNPLQEPIVASMGIDWERPNILDFMK